jgi:hypothetical protein
MPTRRPSGLRRTAALLLVIASAAAAGGGGFVSDRDRRLAMAVTDLRHGEAVRLRSSCRPGVRECDWTFSRGRLVSTAEPNLAISFFDEPQPGRELRVVNCATPQPRCQWVYENGLFLSAVDRRYAIAVAGGARHGARLVLRADCAANQPDCTWSRQ